VVLALVVAGASTCLACTPGTYGNSSGVCSGPALCVSAGFCVRAHGERRGGEGTCIRTIGTVRERS
jgi:hypothetical protein